MSLHRPTPLARPPPPPPSYWSVFYPTGIECLPPIVMHYLHLGCWCTVSCDYYQHRHPKKNEVLGHRVLWLHTAQPRDRFVFLVEPVDSERVPSIWGWFWSLVYGTPPAFAWSKGRLLWNVAITHEGVELQQGGVECVEILHTDVTALDYCPAITSNRLAIETKVVTTHWFPSREAAARHYHVPRLFTLSSPPTAEFAPGLRPTDRVPTPLSLTPPSSAVVGHAAQQASSVLEGSLEGVPPLLELGSAVAHPTKQPEHRCVGRAASTPDLVSFFAAAKKEESNVPRQDSGTPGSTPTPYEGKAAITLCNTMVIAYTQDPHCNAVMREVLMPEDGCVTMTTSVAEQRRLLSLFESGMPAWTIFLSRWGLPYRRWFRLVYVFFYNLWPLIALAVGLFDLYKHMPYLKEFLAERFLPFTEWIERHFTLRISILVTYLLSVSFTTLQALHSFLKSILSVLGFLRTPLTPLVTILMLFRPPIVLFWGLMGTALLPVVKLLGLLWGLLCTVLMPFASLVAGLWTFVATVLLAPFQLVHSFFSFIFVGTTGARAITATAQNASALLSWWRTWLEFWDKVLRPVKNVAKAAYDGVYHVGQIIARREASLRRWFIRSVRHSVTNLSIFFSDSLDLLVTNILLWNFFVSVKLTALLLLITVCYVGIPQLFAGLILA